MRGGRGDSGRMQPLVDKFSTYLSVYGQYLGTPILVSEQCALCGRYDGRVLDLSQLHGSSCDADFSVAKAIEGPRNDERFFFILSAHN